MIGNGTYPNLERRCLAKLNDSKIITFQFTLQNKYSKKFWKFFFSH